MANPFITSTLDSTTSSADQLPLLKEYAWDFEKDIFLKNADGQHVIVTENEALKVWIYKTLKTERFRYVAYHDSYGIELEKYIGNSNIKNVGEMIKADIREGLLVNPYIVSIDNMTITKQEKDIIEITIYLTSIYSKATYKVVM
jgi:hypothetical protein